MKIHIHGGTLIDPASGTEQQQDVYVAAGKIVALGRAPDGFQAAKTIDATGLVVAPGLVDLSARLREPGYEHKATLESEMAAALAGGSIARMHRSCSMWFCTMSRIAPVSS